MHPEYGLETPKDAGSGTGIWTGNLKGLASEEGNQAGDRLGYWSGNHWVTGPRNWHGFQKGDGSGKTFP